MGKTNAAAVVQPVLGGLTAREFFALALPGCSQTDAHVKTRLSYSTIVLVSAGTANARTTTLKRLEAWSLLQPAAKARGVWISAAKTAGFHPN